MRSKLFKHLTVFIFVAMLGVGRPAWAEEEIKFTFITNLFDPDRGVVGGYEGLWFTRIVVEHTPWGPTLGPGEELFLYYANDGTIPRKYKPSIGLGNAAADWAVTISPGGDNKDPLHTTPGAEMIVKFKKGTKHGGFDIRHASEEVVVVARSSHSTGANLVYISPYPGNNFPFPRVTFSGDGEVKCGDSYVVLSGKKVKVQSGRSGATPMAVSFLGWPIDYHFRRDGSIHALDRGIASYELKRSSVSRPPTISQFHSLVDTATE